MYTFIIVLKNHVQVYTKLTNSPFKNQTQNPVMKTNMHK